MSSDMIEFCLEKESIESFFKKFPQPDHNEWDDIQLNSLNNHDDLYEHSIKPKSEKEEVESYNSDFCEYESGQE